MGYKIVACTASRSESGLLEPLIKAFRENGKFLVDVLELPISFSGAFETVQEYLRVHGRPDLAFTSYDRVEMLGACLAFFLNRVKIAQYHAGDVSGSGESFDDYVRFMITLCSDFQFCNSQESFTRCLRFLRLVGKPIQHVYCVGSLAFDDVTLDYSIVPSEAYDLVLYNPPNNAPEIIDSELDIIEKLLDKPTIWVHPNEDEGREKVLERIRKLAKKGLVKEQPTLPRAQFLALMKKAERCIGNSSAFFLEMPYLRKDEHIQVGVRNKNRQRIEVKLGASKRIVQIIRNIFQ
jgi:UDP-N-acetylglucosamine 2-epimerase